MKSRNLLLGIIILFIGVIVLLWRMWPMLLILIGVMILPVKDWLKAILLVLTLCGSVLLYRYEATHSWIHWFSTHIF